MKSSCASRTICGATAAICTAVSWIEASTSVACICSRVSSTDSRMSAGSSAAAPSDASASASSRTSAACCRAQLFSESHNRSLRNPQIPPSMRAREHLYLARRGCADREESFTMRLDSLGRSRLSGLASLPGAFAATALTFPLCFRDAQHFPRCEPPHPLVGKVLRLWDPETRHWISPRDRRPEPRH